MSSSKLVELRPVAPQFVERIWGSFQLEPWFPNPVRKMGEVWFQEPDLGVLVKFLFATENLSVQVHPDDRLAQQCGHARGKTEMWHILRADPSAQIALGFARPVVAADVRRAAADGSIMKMLRWIPVSAGETWFIPAGAVHAIGAGITLCEIQQDSDVTYRLYDYGRGRALHLDESIEALDLNFQPERIDPGRRELVDCPYFRVGRFDVSGSTELPPVDLTVVAEGSGYLNGVPFEQGQVWKTKGIKTLQIAGKATLLAITTKT